VISRLTGDPMHREAALAAVGGPAGIAAEVDDLRSGRLAHEVPYGAAWALHLDVEARQAGIALFADLGSVAAERLVAHLRRDAGRSTDAADYSSPIWAVSALLAWAARAGANSTRRAAADRAESILAAPPRAPNTVPDGFFSPPHLAALLAMQRGLRGSDAAPFANAVAGTAPLGARDIRTAHQAGLNFSRAWGCHAAWQMTGEEAHRDDYVGLVMSHAAMPNFWRDDYDRHAHWVAQFGTFAVAMTEPVWF
jgi:hypothetical protein